MNNQITLRSLLPKRTLHWGIAGLLLLSANSFAGTREQALQIHNRIAGVPPTEAVLLKMSNLIAENKVGEAVDEAMDNETFYSVTLKNLVTPWTNREQTVFAPLNDYTATVIGIVRDDLDFRTVLYGNFLYISNWPDLPPYSQSNNNHYQQAQELGVSLKNTLVPRSQVALTNSNLPDEAASGVITSRAAARAFFIDGTNRAMFRFTLMNHLCLDLEQVHDVTRVPDYIRQDVSRSPGGDSRVFLNNCMGCHSGMDPMSQAYAYYDFEYPSPAADAPEAEALRLKDQGSLHYNLTNDQYKAIEGGMTVTKTGDSRVERKHLHNENNFKQGYITPDNSWRNYWRQGMNSALGWDWKSEGIPSSGTGASSMNKELAHSKAFASCQVQKVFHNVCLRKPRSTADLRAINTFTDNFADAGFSLKQVFRDTADYCKDETAEAELGE